MGNTRRQDTSVDPDWPGGYFGFPPLSPDGKWLAVARSATTEYINISDQAAGPRSEHQADARGKVQCQPHVDTGRQIGDVFLGCRRQAPFNLWTKRADGSAPAVLQFREKRNVFGPRWSPDGKWLIFQTDPAQSGAGDILGIRPGTDSAPVPLVATGFTSSLRPFHPTGAGWRTCRTRPVSTRSMWSLSQTPVRRKWAISTAGGTEPLWSHRGSRIVLPRRIRESRGGRGEGRSRHSRPAAPQCSFRPRVFHSYTFAPAIRRGVRRPALPDDSVRGERARPTSSSSLKTGSRSSRRSRRSDLGSRAQRRDGVGYGVLACATCSQKCAKCFSTARHTEQDVGDLLGTIRSRRSLRGGVAEEASGIHCRVGPALWRMPTSWCRASLQAHA